MPQTIVNSGSRAIQFDQQFFIEYMRDNLFAEWIGAEMERMPIVIKDQLQYSPGTRVVMTLIRQLSGAGITGNGDLRGNEEALTNYSDYIDVNTLRNAVLIPALEQQASAGDLRAAAKPQLLEWSMSKLRSDIMDRLLCPNLDGVTTYANSSEAQKDAWLAANTDRILFGNALGNRSGTDHSASLAAITSAMTLSTGIISLAKRLARKSPELAIRPLKINGPDEFFVLFVPSYAMRDLRASSTMQQANRDAMQRSKDNPLFKDGDLMWESVLIREVPELPTLAGVGDSGIDVAPCFLCGAQALGIGYAEKPMTKVELFDYEYKYGIAVQEIRGVKKLFFNNVQNGMVTIYVAGQADA